MFIETYLNYLRFEKRFSAHTIGAYQHDLTDFLNFSDKAEPELTHKDVRRWILDMVDRGHEASTVNRKISALRSFFRFLRRRGLLSNDPMMQIQSLKTGKRLPATARTAPLNAMLDSLDVSGNDFAVIRDRCILEILYGTGIRRAELVSLKESDVDLYSSQITVTGKRNKQRVIPLSPSVVSLVKLYMEKKIAAEIRNNCGSLFVTNTGLPVYPEFIYRMVRKYLRSAGVKSPHMLRHTFATAMLEAGADLNAIKELLGHSSLAATQVYTHNSISKLKNSYKQAHPKA